MLTLSFDQTNKFVPTIILVVLLILNGWAISLTLKMMVGIYVDAVTKFRPVWVKLTLTAVGLGGLLFLGKCFLALVYRLFLT